VACGLFLELAAKVINLCSYFRGFTQKGKEEKQRTRSRFIMQINYQYVYFMIKIWSGSGAEFL